MVVAKASSAGQLFNTVTLRTFDCSRPAFHDAGSLHAEEKCPIGHLAASFLYTVLANGLMPWLKLHANFVHTIANFTMAYF